MKSFRRAFTMIELLVVISIIGILAAIMMVTFSGGTESARTAACLSNMHSLASACHSYGMKSGYYPAASSFEHRNARAKTYYEVKGWISWLSKNAYAQDAKSAKATSAWCLSTYNQNDVEREFALTNGAIWKYVSGARDIYRCPLHTKTMKAKGLYPNWSYVMNALFQYYYPGQSVFLSVQQYGKIKLYEDSKEYILNPDRVLLFAELPFRNIGEQAEFSTSPSERCDTVLQYSGCDGSASPESIGFNHKAGRNYCANVVFADGHTEKFLYPKSWPTGSASSQMQELTQWLCTGKDVSFNGTEYKEMK